MTDSGPPEWGSSSQDLGPIGLELLIFTQKDLLSGAEQDKRSAGAYETKEKARYSLCYDDHNE